MSDVWCLMSEVWCLMSDVWCLMSEVWCLVSGVWCRTQWTLCVWQWPWPVISKWSFREGSAVWHCPSPLFPGGFLVVLPGMWHRCSYNHWAGEPRSGSRQAQVDTGGLLSPSTRLTQTPSQTPRKHTHTSIYFFIIYTWGPGPKRPLGNSFDVRNGFMEFPGQCIIITL